MDSLVSRGGSSLDERLIHRAPRPASKSTPAAVGQRSLLRLRGFRIVTVMTGPFPRGDVSSIVSSAMLAGAGAGRGGGPA
jgi:hypothetical protein